MTGEEKILRADLIEVVIRNFSNTIVFGNKNDLNIYILTRMLEENLAFETKVLTLPNNDNSFCGCVYSADTIEDETLLGYINDEDYLCIEFRIKAKNDEINVKHLNI